MRLGDEEMSIIPWVGVLPIYELRIEVRAPLVTSVIDTDCAFREDLMEEKALENVR
jgi:hypothetical protein